MKIGIFSPNWIGDAVLALPFIQFIKQQNSSSKIIIICKDWVSGIFENNPYVSEIVSLNNQKLNGFWNTFKTGRELRLKNLDIFYTLTDSLRSAFILRLSNAQLRIGYDTQMRSFLLNGVKPKPIRPIHRSRKYLDLISSYDSSTILPRINLLDEETEWGEKELAKICKTKAVALLPFSIAPNRTLDRLTLKNWIHNTNRQYIIFGSNADTSKANQIIDFCKGTSITSLCGKYSLRDSIRILSHCEYALATDSGLGHIAAALDLPTLSFFGAGNSQITAPRGKNADLIEHCSPCRGTNCKNKRKTRYCLNEISSSFIDSRVKNITKS